MDSFLWDLGKFPHWDFLARGRPVHLISEVLWEGVWALSLWIRVSGGVSILEVLWSERSQATLQTGDVLGRLSCLWKESESVVRSLAVRG